MVASLRSREVVGLLLAVIGLSVASGCGAPPATIELISVAERALIDATDFQSARQAEQTQQLDSALSSLDAAFDADVRLVEAGKITDSTGKTIPLSAEWVISARKGYAAARNALGQHRGRVETAHATHQDNLAAAGEALALAKILILEHSSLTARARSLLTALQRRFIHD